MNDSLLYYIIFCCFMLMIVVISYLITFLPFNGFIVEINKIFYRKNKTQTKELDKLDNNNPLDYCVGNKGDCVKCQNSYLVDNNRIDCHGMDIYFNKIDYGIYRKRQHSAMDVLSSCGLEPKPYEHGYLSGLTQNYYGSLGKVAVKLILNNLGSIDKTRNEYAQGYLTGLRGAEKLFLENKKENDYEHKKESVSEF